MPVDAELLQILACPQCKTPVHLVKNGTALRCATCHRVYPIKDDQQFAYELLAEEKLLIVQGTGFNWPTPDHFRLVFLPNADDLTEAIKRIDEALKTKEQEIMQV